ncbi:MAG TPA: magnesium chelatase domain-containing protein, partial [Blastocatellia bacterium]|nr:magnesium chelatase domain-containing protein [Blastocatellia bacterium]
MSTAIEQMRERHDSSRLTDAGLRGLLPALIGVASRSLLKRSTANGDLKCESLDDTVIVGELSLDGRVRPIKGALSIAVATRAGGARRLL